jgi:nicotinamide phosphoribosyltransferase
VIEAGFEKSVDPAAYGALEYRLHDFGMRGCTCVEQSVLGGVAHLLNFLGSDTMSAAFYAQFTLNNGKPIAESIPATEHSVMTSWRTEGDAIRNMIKQFGGENKVFACVMDSYDYTNALDKVLPSIAEEHTKKGGTIVLRPDSGEPTEVVLQALRAAEKTFGTDTNSKGYKVLRRSRVIQGDGINFAQIQKILSQVLEAGYSAENVAYGMGGGLLQRCNRDTMSFATKLSFIKYADGTETDIMKKPKSDMEKVSFPGILAVKRVNGVPTIFPSSEVKPEENLFRVVYDKRPVANAFPEDFQTLRERVNTEWKALPRKYNPVSDQLKQKIVAWAADLDARFHKLYD